MPFAVPFAHVGHWLVSLLYLAPVAIIALALAWQALRDRTRGGARKDPVDEPTLDDILDGRT